MTAEKPIGATPQDGPGFGELRAGNLGVRIAETQAEIDRLWSALLQGGGQESRCGWLKDRWGLSWQITPKRLGELLNDPDPARAKRVAEAMLTMVKLDIAVLEAAAA